ncbi:MAG: class I SAM-dependent methyltransferase [Burkholderiales bacterium]
MPQPDVSPAEDSLILLGLWLKENNYGFVTVTPATHQRVNARSPVAEAATLCDIFGWSRPFRRDLLPGHLLQRLERDGVVTRNGGLLRSTVRFSTLANGIYVHSAYPTETADAVFFGPDTYRFAALIKRTIRARVPRGGAIIDVGAGSGAGGIVAALAMDAFSRLTLTDINPGALPFARVNAALAGISHAEFLHGDLFAPVQGTADLVVANPPYLVDAGRRVYRHGGEKLGTELATRIVVEGVPRLASGGVLILYTGAPISASGDVLWNSIASLVNRSGLACEYTEIDPDVFGEELARPVYSSVERIAAVSLVVQKL